MRMATVMDDGCGGTAAQQQMQNGGATIHHHPASSSSSANNIQTSSNKMTIANNNNNNNHQQHHVGMQSNHQPPFLCSGCATPIVDQYLLKVKSIKKQILIFFIKIFNFNDVKRL
jgi:hypothetical protein